MASKTAIEWCDHTFNPWRGCTPATGAPECLNCYARNNVGVKLHGIGWGDAAERVIKAESGWEEPYQWTRAAMKAGTHPKVFCGSLCDFFEDNPQVVRARERTWRAIQDCKQLTWMLLTKRPENLARMVPWCNGSDPRGPWPNAWLGVTCGHPDSLWRIEELLKIPAAVRFVSCEPLLEKLDMKLPSAAPTRDYEFGQSRRARINWLIIGGETGPHRRPCKEEWGESLIVQADAAGIPVFNKAMEINGRVSKDPAEWPAWARRREVPSAQ